MPKILCAGLIAVDMVFGLPDYPAKGTKSRAHSSYMIPGGGVLNAASAIATLGGDAHLAGAIGNDMFGAFLRYHMSRRHIDHTLVATLAHAQTSRSAILLNADGDRTIVNHRDAALCPDDFRLRDPFPADAVLLDTRWPDGAAVIAKAAQRAGKPVVIDAEAPVSLAAAALKHASHVVFSEQGLDDFAGGRDCAALTRAAAELGVWCAVTRGAQSVLCHDGQTICDIPTFASTACNTLGAGDVWHGAFALALARAIPEPDAVRFANAASAVRVRKPIADSAFPCAEDVAALLDHAD